MKGNKKLLVVAILLLLVAVSYSTYAIYRSSNTATGSIDLAGWSVTVDGDDIETANLTFDLNSVTWTTNPGRNNTIAPGATGYIEIPVDASGSEVDVILTAAMGTVTGLPNGMTIAVDANDAEKTIQYAADMSTTVKLNVEWSGTLADPTSKDTTDKAVQGNTISIPVVLTARQALS